MQPDNTMVRYVKSPSVIQTSREKGDSEWTVTALLRRTSEAGSIKTAKGPPLVNNQTLKSVPQTQKRAVWVRLSENKAAALLQSRCVHHFITARIKRKSMLWGDGPSSEVLDHFYQASGWMLESQSGNTNISQTPINRLCPAKGSKNSRDGMRLLP